jgi:hypothetical protein
LKGTPHPQQVRQPVNFVVPGVLVMIFATVSMIFAMSVVNANFCLVTYGQEFFTYFCG